MPFYSNIRDIIKKFKKSSFQKEKHFKTMENDDFSINYQESFKQLIDYYQGIFKLVTFFHFNSNISKKVFERNLVEKNFNYEVLPISNSTISGGKKHIELDMSKVKKITYIGQYAEFKGFTDFVDLAKKFKDRDVTFEVYGENIDINLPSNVINKRRFLPLEKKKVFKNTELLIVPSRWKETFGFLGLEALDNNCPILVNENIGMKDLVSEKLIFSNLNIFFKNISSNSYKEELYLTIITFPEHTEQIINIYKKI